MLDRVDPTTDPHKDASMKHMCSRFAESNSLQIDESAIWTDLFAAEPFLPSRADVLSILQRLNVQLMELYCRFQISNGAETRLFSTDSEVRNLRVAFFFHIRTNLRSTLMVLSPPI